MIQGTVSIPVMNVTTETVDANALHLSVSEEQALTDQLRSFWETTTLGITDIKQTAETDVLWKFEQSVKYQQSRYEVSLPWREENINLATNYCTARNRLNGLVKRFYNNDELYEQYDQVIQEYLAEGIIEDVTNVETENPVYYIPHHPIIKESRITTKVRIVFDASSHDRESRSLNECLLTGPNLNPDLLSILIKFRQHRVAMMADITKAFLQIGLNERDRDVLRFLWFKERPAPYEDIKVAIMRMTRVPFGASASPFLLAATIRHHLKKYEQKYPEEVKVLDDPPHGPEWLKDGVQMRETEPQVINENYDVMEYVVQNTMTDTDCTVSPLFDLNRYSRLNRVLRITAWIQRFVHNARTHEKRNGQLCTKEIQQAEQYWIKRTQRDSFPKEMDSLLKNTDMDRQSKIISLKPFLDDGGLMRVGGRLQETNWAFDQKHPYILPGNDTFSELLIRKAHDDVMHSGLQATLNQLREMYWMSSVV